MASTAPLNDASASVEVADAVKASVVTVPSKKASLNSKDDVPKSISLSVVGFNTPSANTICSVPAISNLIVSSSELSST
mgnify:CR=1 FL=1